MKKIILTLSIVFNAILGWSQTYITTTPVTGLKYPVAFCFTPDGRFLVTQKGGNSAGACANAKVLMFNDTGAAIGTFWDFTDSVQCDFERGVLGICTDPGFATNHFVYVYYNHLKNGVEKIRVVRFLENNNVGTNPLVVLNIAVSNLAGNHVGGNVRVNPKDGKLYISIGETAVPAKAQQKTNPFGKILRINTDGSIPTDNPFYDDGNPATGNDDRIWTWGHRNPFDFIFSSINDSLYSSENGSDTQHLGDDEVNMIHKGSNYGWQTCEGYDLYNSSSACNHPELTRPLTLLPAVSGSLPAITGIIHYSSNVMPEFYGHILVGDNDLGRISDITLAHAPLYDSVTSNVVWKDVVTIPSSQGTGLTTLMQGPSDGCIYAMLGGYTTVGRIYKICPPPPPPDTTSHLGINQPKNNLFAFKSTSPNPFSNTTNIYYELKEKAFVNISLYDITGRRIEVLMNNVLSNEGMHTFTIDADKLQLTEGSYFCRLDVVQSNSLVFSQTRKIVLIK